MLASGTRFAKVPPKPPISDCIMSKQEVVKTRLSEGEKKAWQSFCRTNGVSESDMLRMMIQRVCGEAVPIDFPGLGDEKKAGKVTIRLTGTEHRKLIERAKQEGYTNRTNWTTATVLAALHRMPVLTDEEVNTVRESCRQLGAIGRNLNQVARALNIEFRESDKLKQESIEKLAERIDQHLDHVSELFDKTWSRWHDDDDDGE